MIARNLSSTNPNFSQLIGSCKMESRSAPQSTIIGEETPCLPEQLIMEDILPRLPVKSLMKFRCVSKPWCSLIGSKRFIKAHLKYSIKSSWIAHRCIFFDYVDREFKQCGLPSLFDKPFTAPISHISDLGIDKSVIDPVGCCNGLVCILVNSRRFILWNPTTKKFNNLPDLFDQIQVKSGFVGKYVGKHGFGFDELSNDYKVFVAVNVNLKDPKPHCIGMIYSLRSNSWKPIEDSNQVFPISMMGIGIGMYVSGKLHWLDYKNGIVSFDLNSHVFGVVELPSYTKGDLHSVGAVGGCLSAHFFQPNVDLDVWLMKEYGVKKSWGKVATVPFCDHLEDPVPEYYDLEIPVPVAIAPDGEVILVRRSTVVIYNPKCDLLRLPQISALDDGFASGFRSFGIYFESLVSVAPDAQ